MFLLTGAEKVFKKPMPMNLAYALAKTNVHFLAMSMAMRKDLVKESDVICVLPTTLDTKQNRKSYPKVDPKKWLQPSSLAGLIKMWADGSNRPSNGSLAIIESQNGAAVTKFV